MLLSRKSESIQTCNRYRNIETIKVRAVKMLPGGVTAISIEGTIPGRDQIRMGQNKLEIDHLGGSCRSLFYFKFHAIKIMSSADN